MHVPVHMHAAHHVTTIFNVSAHTHPARHIITANMVVDPDYEEFVSLPQDGKPFVLVLPDMDGIPGTNSSTSKGKWDKFALVTDLHALEMDVSFAGGFSDLVSFVKALRAVIVRSLLRMRLRGLDSGMEKCAPDKQKMPAGHGHLACASVRPMAELCLVAQVPHA
eukprot:scaffold117916_cov19-Tisochrysis_lutea.AAC.4